MLTTILSFIVGLMYLISCLCLPNISYGQNSEVSDNRIVIINFDDGFKSIC